MQKKKIDYNKWLTPEALDVVSNWVRNGLTLKQIADNMQMSLSSLLSFRSRESKFDNCFKYSRPFADAVVENSLFKKCNGFYYQTKEEKLTKDGKIIELTKTNYAQPDGQCIIFYLTNKLPEKWQNRRAIESQVNIEDDGLIDALVKSAKFLYNNDDIKKEVDE